MFYKTIHNNTTPICTAPSLALNTSESCVIQLIPCFDAIDEAQRLSDEALAAYLNIDGNTIDTLLDAFDAAGMRFERNELKKAYQNRQSILRCWGSIKPEDDRFRRGGNGGHSRTGNRPEPVIDEEPVKSEAQPQIEKDEFFTAELKNISAKAVRMAHRLAVLHAELAELQKEADVLLRQRIKQLKIELDQR